MNASTAWTDALRESARSYRKMIDATLVQLSDEEFFLRPAAEINSVAVLLRHLGGNLASRWTDFQTTDGEKADRNRDQEFADWPGDRASLMDYFDLGWQKLLDAIETSSQLDPGTLILIRGESQTLASAFVRSLTHLSYHVGQISLIARTVHRGPWHWLTIAPGGSQQHNEQTWGTSQSRGIQGTD
ncbi:DUF1572 family protein [Blastopirellula marina]|uniref:DUF1572 domain-containing protein n=1 Tax=Blastopirellula marina TaxID=124 RepID=A0A2S8F4Z8_9BACT|nr:DUF1572 family protein [Blastopirellula marina]PQO27207.1 hypothetical protein C5Y98_28620 [Blastopirellula marina]PTL41354.1 DUF1572 domain-containing protein [Blastopirellula marina]